MFQTTNYQESFWGIAIHNGPSGKICSESFPETGTETLGYTAVATSRSTAASMTRFRRSIDTNIVWLQTNLSMPRSNSGFQGIGQVNQIKIMRLLSFCDVHGCSFDVHSCSLICMDLLGALVDESLHQIEPREKWPGQVPSMVFSYLRLVATKAIPSDVQTGQSNLEIWHDLAAAMLAEWRIPEWELPHQTNMCIGT